MERDKGRLNSRKLGILGVAVSLISVHYGIGFLLGTGEAVFNYGVKGGLYPVSCALGLIFLSFLASFYWKNKQPLWSLLGSLYGKKVEDLIRILSWSWMLGIVASQVLGAGYILSMTGIAPFWGIVLAMITIALIVSSVPIRKLSFVFLGFLLVSSVALLITFLKLQSLEVASTVINKAIPTFLSQDPKNTIGIALPTILVTVLGMDFHQFIVHARRKKEAIWGSLIAGLLLLIISLLPITLVISAKQQNILSPEIDGKKSIPLILLHIGNLARTKAISYLLVLTLLLTAIGSGSGVSRILIKGFQEITFLPESVRNPTSATIINSVLITVLALTGRSIVSLIVSFYSIYVAGVFIPFLAYYLHRRKIISFSKQSIHLSLISGASVSLLALTLSKTLVSSSLVFLKENQAFYIIIAGIFASILALILPRKI